MDKIKKEITILAIGDRADYDSYKKFHKEKFFILKCGFDYRNTDYRRFLAKGAPSINTKKVIIFLFFPFVYWNKCIEYRNYNGIYGNRFFYKEFVRFWDKVKKASIDFLPDKEVIFVNPPSSCALYRDKSAVISKFSRADIPHPKLYKISRVKDIENLLFKGHSLFLKVQYGSMGKGITFLSWSNWQTNFGFKNGKITSKRAEHGWKFNDITGNKRFIAKLIKKDILIEEAVDSLLLKKMKVDVRVYTFFNKVIYVYPRKNHVDRITTNISQGARGDPNLLRVLPSHLIEKAKEVAVKVSKVLRLNFAGVDVMMDRNLKDIYVIDVNFFPGFPKRRTFNLTQHLIKETAKLKRKGELRFDEES